VKRSTFHFCQVHRQLFFLFFAICCLCQLHKIFDICIMRFQFTGQTRDNRRTNSIA